jgi:hypothetical protein
MNNTLAFFAVATVFQKDTPDAQTPEKWNSLSNHKEIKKLNIRLKRV